MKVCWRSVTVAIIFLAAACNSSYRPTQGEQAAQVFGEVCMGCHKPKADRDDAYFEMASADHNEAYITQKIRKGGMIMPRYAALTDQQVAELAQFVLQHSVVKE